MRLSIYSIGDTKKGIYDQLVQLYIDRVRRWPLKVFPIPLGVGNSPLQIMDQEGDRIINKIPQNIIKIALDRNGHSYSSELFAKWLSEQESKSTKEMCFVIGGSHGLSENVLKEMDKIISFGVQTWPHQLAKVMLLEQIYRAQEIIEGRKYHK